MPSCRSTRCRIHPIHESQSRQALDRLRYDRGRGRLRRQLLNKRADLGLTEVPYRSAAQMAPGRRKRRHPGHDQLDRRRRPFIQAGKVRRIAITSGTRFPGLARSAVGQRGLPGVVMNGWFAVVAPAGMPADIVVPAQSGNRGISQRSRRSSKGCCRSASQPRVRGRPKAPVSSFGSSRNNGGRWRRSSTYRRSDAAARPSRCPPFGSCARSREISGWQSRVYP